MSEKVEKPVQFTGLLNMVESVVEKFLWSFRLIIVLGVFCMLAGSAMIMLLGIAETIEVIKVFIYELSHHGTHFEDKAYGTLIVGIIKVIDAFLLGIVLLIFGLGSYDLFVSRIDKACSKTDTRPAWLVFNSIDELKEVLGKVVLMIMIIHFLQIVVRYIAQSSATGIEALSVLFLGGAIALVSLALKWSHGSHIQSKRD